MGYRRIPLSAFILLAPWPLAYGCGGTAIIDPPLQGAGGASSANSASVGTSTTQSGSFASSSSGTCACSTSNDCPTVDDACYEFSCDGCNCLKENSPAGAPCLAGVCDGAGACVECIDNLQCKEGSCVDNRCVVGLKEVCGTICKDLSICGSAEGCDQGCNEDLDDCDPTELKSALGCSSALGSNCNLDAWIDCMGKISCIDF